MRVQQGDVWQLHEWGVVFSTPEHLNDDLLAGWQHTKLSLTTHANPDYYDEWLAHTEQLCGVTAQLLYRPGDSNAHAQAGLRDD